MAISKKSALKKVIALALSALAISTTVFTVSALSNDADSYGTDKVTPSITSEINTDNILDKASIELGSQDEIIRTDNNGVISLTILKAVPVTIDNKGEKTTVTLARGTVKDALEKAGITLGDDEKVSPSLDTEVTEDTKIKIKQCVTIDLTVKGETNSYDVPKGTVKDALLSLGIDYDSNDKLSQNENAEVYNGMEITLVEVTVKEEDEYFVIDYKTKVQNDSSMYKGESEIAQYGVEGEKVVTKENVYEDGQLVSSKKIKSEITRKPVTQIEKVGTKEKEETFVDQSGAPTSYKKVITGSATAYTAPKGSLTATGAKACVGGVAVNPSIIPYGSKLYIEASDGSYVYGYATAIDTGGALMDGSAIVDLYMDSLSDCTDFGRRDVTIYIL